MSLSADKQQEKKPITYVVSMGYFYFDDGGETLTLKVHLLILLIHNTPYSLICFVLTFVVVSKCKVLQMIFRSRPP